MINAQLGPHRMGYKNKETLDIGSQTNLVVKLDTYKCEPKKNDTEIKTTNDIDIGLNTLFSFNKNII